MGEVFCDPGGVGAGAFSRGVLSDEEIGICGEIGVWGCTVSHPYIGVYIHHPGVIGGEECAEHFYDAKLGRGVSGVEVRLAPDVEGVMVGVTPVLKTGR